MTYSSDVAFTPAVKAVQERKGSRRSYARIEESGSWKTKITPDLRVFIEAQTSVFLATANPQGQPYIQHRGGPPGFLRVLDEETLGFVDFVGNRQYITLGNLAENPKAHLFLIDYAHRQRVKVWGEAWVVEDDPELTVRLMPEGYKARASQGSSFSRSARGTPIARSTSPNALKPSRWPRSSRNAINGSRNWKRSSPNCTQRRHELTAFVYRTVQELREGRPERPCPKYEQAPRKPAVHYCTELHRVTTPNAEKRESPLVIRCKFGAVTNSRALTSPHRHTSSHTDN